MAIISGNIFTNEYGFIKGIIEYDDGIISKVQLSDGCDGGNIHGQQILTEDNKVYIIPGLVDIHTHGCFGYDFSKAGKDELVKIAEYEINHGITSICPTTMTLSSKELHRICRNFKDSGIDSFLGINLEGPFINSNKCGAQNSLNVLPFDSKLLCELDDISGGAIKLVTIAPECEGCLEGIDKYNDRFHFSIGHSLADYEIAMKAFSLGADHVTHLYNAMTPFGHREPGVAGAAFDNGAFVEIIADGNHVHPAVIRSAIRTFGADKVILVSDSCSATGCADGNYMLGDMPIVKSGDKAVLFSDNSTLAGSVLNLYDCFVKAVKNFGISLADAVKMTTYNPAKSIGKEKMVGNICIGAYADLLLIDKDLNIMDIISKGRRY